MDRTLDIAIAGGGIVGLTAALSLHAAGFRPVVYEAVSKPAPLGVFDNALKGVPHHVHILEMIGESFRLASSRKRQKDKEGSKPT